MLGGLARAGPHDRLAGVVDLVRDPVALLERHPRYDPGQRGGDAVEGVVVVVQDDHPPGVAEPLARLLDAGQLDRGGPRHAGASARRSR